MRTLARLFKVKGSANTAKERLRLVLIQTKQQNTGWNDHHSPADAGQMVNLVHDPSADIRPVWKSLHEQLTAHLRDKNALPQFAWPEDPTKS